MPKTVPQTYLKKEREKKKNNNNNVNKKDYGRWINKDGIKLKSEWEKRNTSR